MVNPRSAGIVIGSLFHVTAIPSGLNDGASSQVFEFYQQPQVYGQVVARRRHQDRGEGVNGDLLGPFMRNTCITWY